MKKYRIKEVDTGIVYNSTYKTRENAQKAINSKPKYNCSGVFIEREVIEVETKGKKMNTEEKIDYLKTTYPDKYKKALEEITDAINNSRVNKYHKYFLIKLRIIRKLKYLLPVGQRPKEGKFSIEVVAKRTQDRSFCCKKCFFKTHKFDKWFSEHICFKVCSDAYVNGFKAGIKHERNKNK